MNSGVSIAWAKKLLDAPLTRIGGSKLDIATAIQISSRNKAYVF